MQSPRNSIPGVGTHAWEPNSNKNLNNHAAAGMAVESRGFPPETFFCNTMATSPDSNVEIPLISDRQLVFPGALTPTEEAAKDPPLP